MGRRRADGRDAITSTNVARCCAPVCQLNVGKMGGQPRLPFDKLDARCVRYGRDRSDARAVFDCKEKRMPTPVQKTEIVRSITGIHHEEAGATLDWSRSSSTTLRQTVTTSPAFWRLRIRYGFEPISGADAPTSRRGGCSDG
jgi:hypothetical protein